MFKKILLTTCSLMLALPIAAYAIEKEDVFRGSCHASIGINNGKSISIGYTGGYSVGESTTTSKGYSVSEGTSKGYSEGIKYYVDSQSQKLTQEEFKEYKEGYLKGYEQGVNEGYQTSVKDIIICESNDYGDPFAEGWFYGKSISYGVTNGEGKSSINYEESDGMNSNTSVAVAKSISEKGYEDGYIEGYNQGFEFKFGRNIYDVVNYSGIYNKNGVYFIVTDQYESLSLLTDNNEDIVVIEVDDYDSKIANKNTSISTEEIYSKKGNTMISLKDLAKMIGAEIKVNNKDINVTLDGKTVTINIGKQESFIKTANGTTKTKLNVAPELINGSTFVPLRFISENFNFKIDKINNFIILIK